ncbi:MAG TPA: DUF3108 domain-containing protein [Kofleriaceae bacterium]|nr:DUF3108 domain-containing protein [Kofleriaceae bacterium]
MLRWVVLLSLVGACGGAAAGVLEPDVEPAPAASTAAAPTVDPALTAFYPGENMRFEVRMAGVLAGEATFTTGEPGLVDGHRAIAVTSRIGTAGAAALVKDIRDDATSVIDLDTLMPLSTIGDVQFGPKTGHTEATYHGGSATILSSATGQASHTLVYDFRGQTIHDAHSAMAAMRVWPAEPGAHRELWVLGGRRIWKAEITVGGREVIGTALGNQATLRFDGVSARARPDLSIDDSRPPRTFSVWVSDDADRVPLKIVAHTELGDVTIDLVDYHRS